MRILFTQRETGEVPHTSVMSDADVNGLAREYGLNEQERKALVAGHEVSRDYEDGVAVTWGSTSLSGL